MSTILTKWIVETDDHGRNREDPEVVENVRKDFRRRLHEPRMKKRGLDPNITPKEYLSAIYRNFKTPFFNILSKYLKKNKKEESFIRRLLGLNIFDSRTLYEELSK